ncbi:hypothetical protein [Stenotrophomonas sp. PS02289]|uniref:hypothetical protein n=1 Tax=Stenotrophomonas sp. PS02289 TaxID=2991422 RepID=UPI00249C477C|nr:hypothetical protein [Stenotrophomonas sp. PS02289]
MFNFEECSLADAEIVLVSAYGGDVHVEYRDWQERVCLLKFSDVVGYQSFSPEGRALSHGVVEQDEAFIAHACLMADGESVEGFKVFSFVEAENELKVLRMVARGVEGYCVDHRPP